MRRRDFISAIAVGAAWPVAGHAQQSTMPVIGFLNGQWPDRWAPYVAAFRRGLTDTGYVEGQNVAIEYRWAGGQLDRLPALAADLVGRQVNVIIASGGAFQAAKAATETIPIVTLSGGDPVRGGLVARLDRPEGNVTAVALFAYSLGPKRLEVLRELVPHAKVIAILVNSSSDDPESKVATQEVEAAARAVGQQIDIVSASSESDIDAAFTTVFQRAHNALLVMADPFFNSRREQLVTLATHYKIPTIFEWREFAMAGGLLSYGASISDAYRQLGIYAGKILKGAKPADLPVMQAVKVELVLNLKTAKSLGLTFPLPLLGRADEVIE